MKKSTLLIISLLIIISFSACNKFSVSSNDKTDAISDKQSDNTQNNEYIMNHAEIIDDHNRSLIGKIVQNASPPLHLPDAPETTSNSIGEADLNVPENPIVNKLASKDIVSPLSITAFDVSNNTTPEIIMPCGSAAIFSQKNNQGWTCKEGNRLLFKFNKYPSEAIGSQTMTIGYALNGVFYPGEEFKDLDGTYQLDITKEGNYHIYIISATTDYLALKQSTITINP